MEDRISSLESFSQMHITLTRIINEHMNLMDDRQRQYEEWQRQSEEWQRRSEEWQRRSEEWQRRSEEWQRQADEGRGERDTLLQQLLQSVALMQADIVRIDETHA